MRVALAYPVPPVSEKTLIYIRLEKYTARKVWKEMKID